MQTSPTQMTEAVGELADHSINLPSLFGLHHSNCSFLKESESYERHSRVRQLTGNGVQEHLSVSHLDTSRKMTIQPTTYV